MTPINNKYNKSSLPRRDKKGKTQQHNMPVRRCSLLDPSIWEHLFTGGDSDSDSDEPLPQPQPLSSDSSESDLEISMKPSTTTIPRPRTTSASKASEDQEQINLRSDSDSDSSDADDDSDFDSKVDQPLSRRQCPSNSNTCDSSYSFDSGLQFTMKPTTTTADEPSKASGPPPHKWSQEEQISLLHDLIVFKSQREKHIHEPCIFPGHIYKKLDIQLPEITEEINRLNAKFCDNMDKPNPPDDLVFYLSKKLWGTQLMKKKMDLHSKYPILAATFDTRYLSSIQRNIDLIPSKKLRDLEKELKKLQDQEANISRKREKIIRDNYRWLRKLDQKECS
ncbi:uncharacterized protein LOC129880769 [Solanum dulcamara]|uniref:uncharacterized protein LOC129880769 n=1 Tax=Solanum dulcamara TaxID=45834 RepID=UPI002486352E|nr:uncharacterized protein LOC129880769 [Solanum dulcamara]